MAEWRIQENGVNGLEIKGLDNPFGGGRNCLLIVRYPEGDCDIIRPTSPRSMLIRALYDLYQVDDRIRDGDEFVYEGCVVAVYRGVHVIERK